MARRSFLRRALRAADHVVFDQSRLGRAAEVAAWANAASAFAVAVGVGARLWARFGTNAAWLGLVAGALTLLVLRLALAHRYSLWLAASAGTLTLASLGAAIGWVFGHAIEVSSAPSIAAVLCALVSAILPAWAYSQLAKHRQTERDSLLSPPVSAPPSH